MKISVIMTTYNRPDALKAVLEAMECQKGIDPADWELLIADDGSAEATRSLIEQFSSNSPLHIEHVWHEDKGFRAAEIRNRAAVRARGDYLVFLDGDCIPMQDFLVNHLKLAEPGKSVAGNRILLSKNYTGTLLASTNPIEPLDWGVMGWCMAKFTGKVNKSVGWLRLDLTDWRDRKASDWRIYRSCNIGLWKKDMLGVDGFDAGFSGWGYEDSDLAVRLLRYGVRFKDGRFAVPVLHLWHAENDRSSQDENWNRFEKSLNGDHIKALQGMSSLENEKI